MPQEKVNDLRFFDGHGEEVDLFKRLNLHVLDQVAQLGDPDPLLVLYLASASSTAPPQLILFSTLALDTAPKSTEAAASHLRALAPASVVRRVVFPRRRNTGRQFIMFRNVCFLNKAQNALQVQVHPLVSL